MVTDTSYSIRQKTLLAVAILHGAGLQGKDLTEVPYALLLWYLIVVPAMPPRGWSYTGSGSYPAWRNGLTYDTLINMSRMCKLHKAVGRGKRGVTLLPNDALAALVKEAGVSTERCLEWYNEALQGIAVHER